MKALCTDTDLTGLAVRDLPLPEPRRGEVRVRVAASALNPADQKVLSGQFIGKILHGRERPIVVGYDLAGTVDAIGEGADLAVGDEVFGHLAYGRATRRGAFAEAAVIRAADLARRPASLSPGDACAIATAGCTALQSLRDHGKLAAGQSVLVIGASGGVGSLAVGVAAKLGAEVTGLCSAATADLVRSLGASTILIRGKDDLQSCTQRFHVVFDTAAAYSYGAMRHLLHRGGTYVTTLPSPGMLFAMPRARLAGKRVAFINVKSRRADLEQLAAWVGDGMKLAIDSTFPVRDLGQALARYGQGGMKGRIVITVAGGF